jgi:hypothetical protein
VYIDGNFIVTFQTNLDDIDFNDGKAWVGFTSGQGLARQDIDIWNWSFTRSLQMAACQVAITSNPSQTISVYATPLDVFTNNPIGGLSLNGGSAIVDQRALLRDDIVRVSGYTGGATGGFPPTFWFIANGNSVTETISPTNCDDIPIEDKLAPSSPGLQRAFIIAQLEASYKVRVMSGGRLWTNFEVREIYRSVTNIADAFRAVSGRQANVQANEIFKTVFDATSPTYDFVILLRTENADTTVSFTYNGTNITGTYSSNPESGFCSTVEAGTYNNNVALPSAIICRSDLANAGSNAAQPLSLTVNNASQHTITHEFGHIFDYLSKRHHIIPNTLTLTPIPTATAAGQGFITSYIDDGTFPDGSTNGTNFFSLIGCDGLIIMGYVPSNNPDDPPWQRGKRGWGSAPLLSMYLQNSNEILPLEAAADMFLNWVYRVNLVTALIATGRLTPIQGTPALVLGNNYIQNYSTNVISPATPSAGCFDNGYNPAVVTDSGFYNIKPSTNQPVTAAPADTTAWPGDIRQAFMNDIMNKIFTHNGW